jgi:hypothetical protein
MVSRRSSSRGMNYVNYAHYDQHGRECALKCDTSQVSIGERNCGVHVRSIHQAQSPLFRNIQKTVRGLLIFFYD